MTEECWHCGGQKTVRGSAGRKKLKTCPECKGEGEKEVVSYAKEKQ
jgi:DnaJ-class molecular chaperone